MPTRIHWRSALIIGGLMLMIANGGVTWSEQHVPSGIAALIVAIVPIWMVVIDWVRPRGMAPKGPVIIGLVLGLIGMVLLIGPGNIGGNNHIDPLGALALVISTLGWANGSIYARHAPLPDSPVMATAMEMLCGGALLMVAAGLTGEWARVDLAQVSLQSVLAISYLIVFGSIIAFSAYIFLLKATSPAQAATYAYVNPVVAVFLGWAIAKEPLTLRTIIAAVIIVSAVAVITAFRARRTIELAGEVGGTPVDNISPLLEQTRE
jgi:drug/metabolite transporter (DMT)-like permease